MISTGMTARPGRWGAGTRHESPAQGQELILAAAVRCYERQGITPTTLEDIAREACVSRRTLYRYFPSRQAMIQAVVEQQAHVFFQDMEASLAGAGDDFKSLLGHCMLYAIEHGPQIAGYRLLLQGDNSLSASGYYLSSEANRSRWRAMLEQPFLQAKKRGDIADGIDLDMLLGWAGRLILSYVQHPEPLQDIATHIQLLLRLK
jgi:AcrR family transcriptional regulator